MQTSRSDVQTQTSDSDHQLVQFMPKDQTEQLQRTAAAPFLEAILGQDKQVQVDCSAGSQTLNMNESIRSSSSQPHVLIQVVSSSQPHIRPVYSQNEIIPGTLGIQTQVKHDSPQSPVPTHKHILLEDHKEATDIQGPPNPILIAGISGATLESVHPPVAVEQLLREAEHTRRMVTLDNKVSREAIIRRRECLLRELSGKYEKWDVRHKEFMKRIEKEDNEQLSRILLGKFAVTSRQPFVDVPAPQFSEMARQNKDMMRSEPASDSKHLNSGTPVTLEQHDGSVVESLLQVQVTSMVMILKNVSEIGGSDFEIH